MRKRISDFLFLIPLPRNYELLVLESKFVMSFTDVPVFISYYSQILILSACLWQDQFNSSHIDIPGVESNLPNKRIKIQAILVYQFKVFCACFVLFFCFQSKNTGTSTLTFDGVIVNWENTSEK